MTARDGEAIVGSEERKVMSTGTLEIEFISAGMRELPATLRFVMIEKA